jgi:hypothetical protein
MPNNGGAKNYEAILASTPAIRVILMAITHGTPEARVSERPLDGISGVSTKRDEFAVAKDRFCTWLRSDGAGLVFQCTGLSCIAIRP